MDKVLERMKIHLIILGNKDIRKKKIKIIFLLLSKAKYELGVFHIYLIGM